MSRIAIDIDSTLYDFCALACQTMGEMVEEAYRDPWSTPNHWSVQRLMNGAYSTTWTEWRTPIDLVGDAWTDVVDRCHRPDVIRSQDPFPGAKEALWDLHERGHKLIYVSNRDTSTYRPTLDWLISRGFPVNELLCHTDDKLAMVADCQYIVDDRPKTLVGFLTQDLVPEDSVFASERKAFGLVMPYNRNLTDIPGVYLAPSWPLLGRYLREKIPSSD